MKAGKQVALTGMQVSVIKTGAQRATQQVEIITI